MHLQEEFKVVKFIMNKDKGKKYICLVGSGFLFGEEKITESDVMIVAQNH